MSAQQQQPTHRADTLREPSLIGSPTDPTMTALPPRGFHMIRPAEPVLRVMPTPPPAKPARRLPAMRWELVPADQQDRVSRLHPHIIELICGVKPDSETRPDPRYSLNRSLAARIDAKVAELRQAGQPIGRSRLYELVHQFEQEGLLGLADGRALRVVRPTGFADPQLIDLIERWIDSQTDQPTRTWKAAAQTVAIQAEAQGLAVPSMSSLLRYLKVLDGDRGTFGKATSRRSRANRPKRPFGQVMVTRPGQIIEIDATPLDALVTFEDGTVARPDLQIAVDVATRTICAALLRRPASRTVDVIELLRKGFTPWRDRPAADVDRDGVVLSARDRQQAFDTMPVIWPTSISVDRGKCYDSALFDNACATLGITTRRAAPYTPTDKPHVERTFRTINTEFLQHLAGYVGSDVTSRGKHPHQDAHWTLHDLQNVLDEWIAHVYQNMPREGLWHASCPGKNLSPNQMYQLLADEYPQTMRALTREQSIGLLPVEHRVLQRYGINLDRLTYTSPELDEVWTGRGRQAGFRGKVEVRHDPDHRNMVWVRKPNTDQFIAAYWKYDEHFPAAFDKTAVARHNRDSRSQGAEHELAFLKQLYTVQQRRRQPNSDSTRPRKAKSRKPKAPSTGTVPLGPLGRLMTAPTVAATRPPTAPAARRPPAAVRRLDTIL